MKRFAHVGFVLALAAAVPAQAAVDLEWRLENEFIQVGDTVRVGLYAVADNGEDEVFAAMTAIMNWDPGALALLGNDNNGPYEWMVADFLPGDTDGLNDTFDDGDAYFSAASRLDEGAVATADGLLVTTIEFEALAPVDPTELLFIEEFGEHSQTAVWRIGFNIVDDLDIESIVIAEGGPEGDLDGDGDVDLSDLSWLLAVYGLCDGDPGYDPIPDIDQDGCVGLSDLSALLANYGL